jgi:L-alanine-DL-glutamate epimerase-like enolase superfamily enzyme
VSHQQDKIIRIKISKLRLPLKKPVSDAKVLTGVQKKPLENVDLLFAHIRTKQGLEGLGFSYALRVGGRAQYAHAKEIAGTLIGEDPYDIQKIWNNLMWLSATAGNSGITAQSIAAIDSALWDLKAKKAGLPLAKLIGSHYDSVRCYNTSGGYLQASIEEVIEKSRESLDRGMGGIKMKVGQPDMNKDLRRLDTLRNELGLDIPIMVDANQQWDRVQALQFCRQADQYHPEWIEEPLNAYDVEGHTALTAKVDSPIATGEMLCSSDLLKQYISHSAVDVIQPDAARIGGITPYLKIADLADAAGMRVAPHFIMEIHVHLSACYPRESWVEHFEWLEPLFNERLKIQDGRMYVPEGPGLGFTLSEYYTKCLEEEVILK